MKQFKEQMTALKERLNSCVASSKVSLMCDAWTAGNGDGYFAVTGHWIEKLSDRHWILQEALLGLDTLHVTMQQTMILCWMTHIINLAMQAIISTRSKAKYYDANTEDLHIPDMVAKDCDEVGLIQAICVKARSLSQRKELFRFGQDDDDV
ncbi:hypothetical protein CVT25_008679 [Psilocybe cyanescens]|uniref:DUF659 domain-containing protein n=1 Tax=Psilocybe cyanescens TaxID=93625 RepID=A0A409XLG3_PSICY|nr:hypothetical protein CVT25_008679 [Psilocybe cyanescens]